MNTGDESSDVMPVTSLDDEQQTNQNYGSPNSLIVESNNLMDSLIL